MRRSWFESMRGNAGVAQRKSGALIRRRSVVQISPPAPIPAVVQWPERLNVNQEAGGSTPSPGTIFLTRIAELPALEPRNDGPRIGGVAQRKSGGLQNRVSAGSIPASPANSLDVRDPFSPRAPNLPTNREFGRSNR